MVDEENLVLAGLSPMELFERAGPWMGNDLSLLREACRSMKSGALFDIAGVSNENDEWYTPSWLFKALDVEFDLDPCSPGAPPSSVPAKRHLTKADNGLTAPWEGSVWLNPPFSGKRPWYERLVKHGNGIALMPARTETHDFQTYMNAANALLFLRGRIYFERGHRPGANGNGSTTTPPFGIVLCAYGDAMARSLIDSGLLGVRAAIVNCCGVGRKLEPPTGPRKGLAPPTPGSL